MCDTLGGCRYAAATQQKRQTNKRTDRRNDRLHHSVSSALWRSLDSRGNYSTTSNNAKLVHWPLMGGLLHLEQRVGAWAGCGPAQSRPRCNKYHSPPINGQCTNHCIAIWRSVQLRCSAVLMWRLKGQQIFLIMRPSRRRPHYALVLL